MNDLEFNSRSPTIMHIDLNSCFAAVEQQANPHLRGRPVVVAAYDTPGGCILAPSLEAKRLGVKTGMRVRDGKILCPGLIILSSDPWKYRSVHLSLRKLLSTYTPDITPKSIDEFVLDFSDFVKVSPWDCKVRPCKDSLRHTAEEIKYKIKSMVGDWLTVSIGISTNRFLAKLASNLRKPDGLEVVDGSNFRDVYSGLELTELPYIKLRNAARLAGVGIRTVTGFYQAPLWKLKAAFRSINGYYWHLRLRGWEIDDFVTERKSFGNSYALPVPLSSPGELSPILSKLVTKMSSRLRFAGYRTRGIHLGVSYKNGSFWHKGVGIDKALSDARDIFKIACRVLSGMPGGAFVRELSVSCFNLIKSRNFQLELFEDLVRKEKLISSIDEINNRWGEYVVVPGRMLDAKNLVPDRIAFGGIRELEEFTLN
jgi:DNA polymerase IV